MNIRVLPNEFMRSAFCGSLPDTAEVAGFMLEGNDSVMRVALTYIRGEQISLPLSHAVDDPIRALLAWERSMYDLMNAALSSFMRDEAEFIAAACSSEELSHVDHFMEFGSWSHENDDLAEAYARWWFHNFVVSALLRIAITPFMRRYDLYCDYEGKRYRVTGASRLGDVWLNSDMRKREGYTDRVCYAQCSNWGNTSTKFDSSQCT